MSKGEQARKAEKDMSSEFHSGVLNQLATGVFITEADKDRFATLHETRKERYQL